MAKDGSERKLYRKSPGRQYGYDYDPLQNGTGRSGQNRGAQGERATDENTSNRVSTQLVQRPDLRRTRQLTRKNILASKGRSVGEGEEQEEQLLEEETYERPTRRSIEDEQEDDLSYRGRPIRSGDLAAPHLPSTRQLIETGDEEDEEGEWQDYQGVDPDADYEDPDPMDVRMGYIEAPPRSAAFSPRASVRTRYIEPEEDDYEDVYEDEQIRQPRRRNNNKSKVSRRKLLFGLGATAVGGVAAYELVPRIPGAVNGAASNIEHQLEDAFNKGVAQGADNARKELLTALQNLEGFTLGGAINAAKLTRVAYDVFVSPIIKFGAAVTGDFLNGMLRAVKTARGFLAQGFMDNPTLQAVQHVLESWVTQVSNLPKQLDAITDTDLDGAQMYLKALEQKIKDEQAKMNKNGSSTPAPAPKSK